MIEAAGGSACVYGISSGGALALQAAERLTGSATRVMVALMQLMPVWSKLKALAHTLPYDAQLIDGAGAGQPLPADRGHSVTIPTLAMAGSKSPGLDAHRDALARRDSSRRRIPQAQASDTHRQTACARSGPDRAFQRRITESRGDRQRTSPPHSSSMARTRPASESPTRSSPRSEAETGPRSASRSPATTTRPPSRGCEASSSSPSAPPSASRPASLPATRSMST